jgi:hypothetical protein
MMDKRIATSPPPAAGGSVLTPEEIRRIELNRLKGTYQPVRGRLYSNHVSANAVLS